MAALLLLLLPLLAAYASSARCRYHAKFFAYYSLVAVVSTATLPLIAWRPRNLLNCLIVAAPLRWIATLLGLRFELRGKEHMRADRAAVVVANHQSAVDVLGLVHLWPHFRKMTIIAKSLLLYAGPFGAMMWLVGIRFINRSNPAQSRRGMDDALECIQREKAKLWVFPEGTRNSGEEMLPFKKGAFHLAITGQLPILPVVFSSYKSFLNSSEEVFNPGNVIVTCLPAISTEGLTLEDMPRLIEDVRTQMSAAFTQTSNQVQQPHVLVAAGSS